MACWLLGCGACAPSPSAANPAAPLEIQAPLVEVAAASAATPPSPPPPSLVHKWLLKEVRYRHGQPSFVPRTHGGLTFDRWGGVGWSDGCNQHGGSYEVEGNRVRLRGGGSTLKLCSEGQEDVHYTQVTHFELADRRLELFTPTQSYVLERFPHSRMSEHAWSLHSMVTLATGEVADVDRFRHDYFHLFLAVEADARFRFIDLDHEEFTGTIWVREPNAVRFRLDPSSRARLAQRGEQLDSLRDAAQGYARTAQRYPTTLAQRLDWDGIESFAVLAATIVVRGKEEDADVLELATASQRYRFVPR